MNVYKDILNIDESIIQKLSSMGLLRSTATRDLEIYAYYLKELESSNGKEKIQAHINTADHFNISDDRVKTIIYKIRNHV